MLIRKLSPFFPPLEDEHLDEVLFPSSRLLGWWSTISTGNPSVSKCVRPSVVQKNSEPAVRHWLGRWTPLKGIYSNRIGPEEKAGIRRISSHVTPAAVSPRAWFRALRIYFKVPRCYLPPICISQEGSA